MGIQVKDSNRLILARMFNKIQLTVFTLLVFVCCVVIFPIHCDLSKLNTVSCILLNILASIYRFESFTWIPIQILYIHGHFKLRNMKLHVLMIKLTHWAWAACDASHMFASNQLYLFCFVFFVCVCACTSKLQSWTKLLRKLHTCGAFFLNFIADWFLPSPPLPLSLEAVLFGL